MPATLVLAALLGIVLPGQQPERPSPAYPPPCAFAVVRDAPPAVVTGPDTLVARTLVVRQPGSPAAVVAVDLKDSAVDASAGLLRYAIDYSVDVRNVSDQPLNDLIVMVSVETRSGGGGSGASSRSTTVEPGRTVRISGGGRGSGPRTDQAEPQILVFVQSVRLDGCTYKPAQILPTRGGGTGVVSSHHAR